MLLFQRSWCYFWVLRWIFFFELHSFLSIGWWLCSCHLCYHLYFHSVFSLVFVFISCVSVKVACFESAINFLFYYSGFSLLFFECSSTSCVLQSVMYVYIVSVLAWPHVWSTNFSMHWFSSVLPHTSRDMSSCLVSYPYNHRLHLYCMLSIGWSNT